MSTTTAPQAWDEQRRADALMGLRDRLVARLPRLIRQAGRLTEDVRELVVDESIQFAALDYAHPIHSAEELERVFWDAALKRVRRAHEGRYDTVRGGYGRTDLAVLDTLPSGATPEDEVLRRAELRVALEFAARLAPTEQRVWACQHTAVAARPLGHTTIARRARAPGRGGARGGAVDRGQTPALRCDLRRGPVVRLRRPRHRRARRGRHGRAIRRPRRACIWRSTSARPAARTTRGSCATCAAPASTARSARCCPHRNSPTASRLGGLRDVIVDWATRLTGHDPGASVGQLAASGAGRGVGSAAAVKLATLCLAGAGTVGACVATGVLPNDARPDHPTKAGRRDAHRRAHAGRARTARTAFNARRRPRRLLRDGAHASPARELGEHRAAPGRAVTSRRRPRRHPRTRPPNGASEFDPSYQPSGPPQPAPAPAAPGGANSSDPRLGAPEMTHPSQLARASARATSTFLAIAALGAVIAFSLIAAPARAGVYTVPGTCGQWSPVQRRRQPDRGLPRVPEPDRPQQRRRLQHRRRSRRRLAL